MEFFLDGKHVRLRDRIHGAYLLRSYLHADSLSVASLLNKEIHTNTTLCVSPGSKGRLTPLLVDLPCNNEPIAIIVLITGSPGENYAVSSVFCSALVMLLLMEGLPSLVDYTD